MRINAAYMIRNFILFSILNTSSTAKAAEKSKNPMMRKSKSDQFTSSVNRIATNGMESNTNGIEKIAIVLCFCVIIVFKFNYYKVLWVSKLIFKKLKACTFSKFWLTPICLISFFVTG
jgi:hypothetical protein